MFERGHATVAHAYADPGADMLQYNRPSCERLNTSQPLPPQQAIMDLEIERLSHAGARADDLIYGLECFADRLIGRSPPPETANGKSMGCDVIETMPPVIHRLSHLIDQGHQRASRIERLLDRLAPLA